MWKTLTNTKTTVGIQATVVFAFVFLLVLEYRVFGGFRYSKLYDCFGRNLYLLTGGRIAAHTGGAVHLD